MSQWTYHLGDKSLTLLCFARLLTSLSFDYHHRHYCYYNNKTSKLSRQSFITHNNRTRICSPDEILKSSGLDIYNSWPAKLSPVRLRVRGSAGVLCSFPIHSSPFFVSFHLSLYLPSFAFHLSVHSPYLLFSCRILYPSLPFERRWGEADGASREDGETQIVPLPSLFSLFFLPTSPFASIHSRSLSSFYLPFHMYSPFPILVSSPFLSEVFSSLPFGRSFSLLRSSPPCSVYSFLLLCFLCVLCLPSILSFPLLSRFLSFLSRPFLSIHALPFPSAFLRYFTSFPFHFPLRSSVPLPSPFPSLLSFLNFQVPPVFLLRSPLRVYLLLLRSYLPPPLSPSMTPPPTSGSTRLWRQPHYIVFLISVSQMLSSEILSTFSFYQNPLHYSYVRKTERKNALKVWFVTWDSTDVCLKTDVINSKKQLLSAGEWNRYLRVSNK